MKLSTPYVAIDLDKVEKNISSMASGLRKVKMKHRPHIKPHKSIELAKLQIQSGASGVTCATLSEAEIMISGGINDILIASPLVGERNLNRLSNLLNKAKIITIVDSISVAKGLSMVGQKLNKKIEVLIEVDGGIHRGGVQPGQPALDFANSIIDFPGIKIIGIFTYFGQIYRKKSLNEIKETTKKESEMLVSVANLFKSNGIDLSIISGGSTPSSLFAEELKGITEVRAGNYIFFDMNSVHLGIAKVKDVALRIYSTIVSTPLSGYATIDAGSKTLTSDLPLKGSSFGFIVGKPDVQISKLNEEHGYLRYDPKQYNFKVGDRVEIIPNHACVILNLNHRVYGHRKNNIKKEIVVDARGKNY